MCRQVRVCVCRRTHLLVRTDAQDLIRRFLTEPEHRLGRNGCDDIKAHAFFQNDDWTFDTIRKGWRSRVCAHTRAVPPPHVPELSGDDDTRHFEDVEEAQPNPAENLQPPKAFAGNQLPFIGFTYSKEFR
jgi:hypothetical protein